MLLVSFCCWKVNFKYVDKILNKKSAYLSKFINARQSQVY